MENTDTNLEGPPVSIIYGIFIFLAGLILPFFLIFVVKFTGYSEIVEEVAKALVVLFLILKMPSHKSKILGALFFGLLFGVSENFLYLNQIFQLGDMSVFLDRFLWTVPMHIVTTLLILFSGLAGRIFIIFGLTGAIIVHTIFNSIVVDILVK